MSSHPESTEVLNGPNQLTDSNKRRRRDPALRAQLQFACPLYTLSPMKYGGPGGCAQWCTSQIHRLYCDHLKMHVDRGHIPQELFVHVKSQKIPLKKNEGSRSDEHATLKESRDKQRWIDTWRALQKVEYAERTEMIPASEMPCPYYRQPGEGPGQMQRHNASEEVGSDDMTAEIRVSASTRAQSEVYDLGYPGPRSQVPFLWPQKALSRFDFDLSTSDIFRLPSGHTQRYICGFSDCGHRYYSSEYAFKLHRHNTHDSQCQTRFYCKLRPCNLSWDRVLPIVELKKHMKDRWPGYEEGHPTSHILDVIQVGSSRTRLAVF